jgi:electron transfer flavoprotein beta subunit
MISDTAAPRPVVVACLRIGDLHATVDPLTGAVRTERAGLGLSDADAAALEHALRAGERWSAPVAAVTAGTVDVESVLREVAALGVSVLRVEVGGPGDGIGEQLVTDEHGLAREVAAALLGAFGPPLLVVCGDRSPDRGTGAFPAFLAHELGAAQALGLVALSVADRHDGILADRRLDAGWRERLRVPLPAVCSVEGAGVRLRRASLEGALAAATLAVPVTRRVIATGATMDGERVRVGSTRAFAPRPRVVPAPAAEDPRLRVLALCGALEQRDPPVVVGPVDAAAAADELLSFLDRHGYLETVDVEVSQGRTA